MKKFYVFLMSVLSVIATSLSAQTLDVIVTANDSICKGDNTTLRVTPQNPLKVTNIQWSNGQSGTVLKEIVVKPDITTTYSVTVTESGTSYNLSKTITVIQPPLVNAGKDTTICKGTEYQLRAETNDPKTAIQWLTNTTGLGGLMAVAPADSKEFVVSVVNFFGCTNKDTVKVNIIGESADFGFTNMAMFNFSFNDNSTNIMLKRYWDFGDGFISNDKTVNHDFQKEGVYNVCLTTVDPLNGCFSKACKEMKIGNPKCDARFNVVANPVAEGAYTFSIINLPTTAKYFWNFGDGGIATEKSPSYVFNKPGVYAVTLGVYDDQQKCKDVTTQIVRVGQPHIKADFNYYVDLATQTVAFKNVSLGKIKASVWDFGNNKPTLTNLMASPYIKYDNPGVYKVCLVVADDSSKIDMVCKNVVVDTAFCSADFRSFVDSSSATALLLNKSIGGELEYFWEFGDGTSSKLPEPLHQYKAPGLYNIALTIANQKAGCIDKVSKVVLVSNMNKDCHADFYFQDDNVANVAFFNTSLSRKGNKFIWDFGDGSKSESLLPVHTYLQKGFYNVCLTAIDEENKCKDTRCKSVRVGLDDTKTLAAFNYFIHQDSLNVSFADMSIGDPNFVKWDFGDGTYSSLKNPSHTYKEAGFYKVRQLTGIIGTKNYSFSFDVIPVGLKTGIKCAFDKLADTANFSKGVFPIEFKGAAYGEPSEFEWDFGDGASDTSNLSTTHVYEEEGMYITCLTVYDEVMEQSDTYCDTVFIGTESIAETKVMEQFKVVPNPAKTQTQLYYTLNGDSNVEISVYDIIGNKVKTIASGMQEKGFHNATVNVNDMMNGIYFIHIKTGNSVSTFKLLVVK